MKVFVGCDHAGFEAKKEVLDILEQLNIDYTDVGPFEYDENDDYPIISKKVCRQVLDNIHSLGILICGSGAGVALASNKVNGIRAIQGLDEFEAKFGKAHEDANVLCLRGREFDHSKYYGTIKTFIDTKFSNEKRHIRRINQLKGIEDEQ